MLPLYKLQFLHSHLQTFVGFGIKSQSQVHERETGRPDSWKMSNNDARFHPTFQCLKT